MAVERLPTVSIFHYNLACYECQLGQLEVAKARLAHAFKLDPAWRLAALDDKDLRPIWDSARHWGHIFIFVARHWGHIFYIDIGHASERANRAVAMLNEKRCDPSLINPRPSC